MVIDKIENLKLYEKLNPRFSKAMDYLQNTDFTKLEPGKHIVDGEQIFAIYQEYQTKDVQECMLEGHKKYIDIQYILEGKEAIGITHLIDQPAKVPYDADRDVAFFHGEGSPFKLEAGNFTIFFPDDLHMPCLKVGESSTVKKIVMKISTGN
jgi:YhcH/YjgK/YiaL family protein